MRKQMLAIAFPGIGINYLLINQTSNETGRRLVLDFHSNFDEGWSLSGQAHVYVVDKTKTSLFFDWRHAIFSINSIYLQFALFFILFVKWKIISETAAEILVIYMCLCL